MSLLYKYGAVVRVMSTAGGCDLIGVTGHLPGDAIHFLGDESGERRYPVADKTLHAKFRGLFSFFSEKDQSKLHHRARFSQGWQILLSDEQRRLVRALTANTYSKVTSISTLVLASMPNS